MRMTHAAKYTTLQATQDQRWRAVRTRAQGAFVYAVRTTGIFCRPGCPSRTPKRGNVEFFDDSRRPPPPAIEPAGAADLPKVRPHRGRRFPILQRAPEPRQ